jgi:hypothetical protein
VVGLMLAAAVAASTQAQQQPIQGAEAPNVYNGVLSNVGNSRELSTGELRQILMDSSAIVLDARPYEEYAVSHIPGARSVRGKPGTTPALYVADASEVVENLPDREPGACPVLQRSHCGFAANALPTSC